MTISERRHMIVKAIRKMEDMLCALKYYDGIKSRQEREAEIERLQGHLHCAHSVLVLIDEEDLAA